MRRAMLARGISCSQQATASSFDRRVATGNIPVTRESEWEDSF